MREDTVPDIARRIVLTVAERSLDIRDMVKFRRAMKEQTVSIVADELDEEILQQIHLLSQQSAQIYRPGWALCIYQIWDR